MTKDQSIFQPFIQIISYTVERQQAKNGLLIGSKPRALKNKVLFWVWMWKSYDNLTLSIIKEYDAI